MRRRLRHEKSKSRVGLAFEFALTLLSLCSHFALPLQALLLFLISLIFVILFLYSFPLYYCFTHFPYTLTLLIFLILLVYSSSLFHSFSLYYCSTRLPYPVTLHAVLIFLTLLAFLILLLCMLYSFCVLSLHFYLTCTLN